MWENGTSKYDGLKKKTFDYSELKGFTQKKNVFPPPKFVKYINKMKCTQVKGYHLSFADADEKTRTTNVHKYL